MNKLKLIKYLDSRIKEFESDKNIFKKNKDMAFGAVVALQSLKSMVKTFPEHFMTDKVGF